MKLSFQRYLVWALMIGLALGPQEAKPADPDGTLVANSTNGVTDSNPMSVEEPEPGALGSSTNAAPASEPGAARRSPTRRHKGNENVVIGSDVEVKAGETVDEVVVIDGSARIRGQTRHDVVVIRGTLEVEGKVGGDAVVVLGNIKVRTNATIKGDAVAVLGGVQVQTNASVGGDVVGLGGKTEIAEGAVVSGDVVPINLGVGKLSLPKWLERWFMEGGMKLRPLPPRLGWAWAVVGGFFVFYLLIALALPRPVQACVEELARRPATTFLLGLLTKVLLPLVLLILVVTLVGLFVVPFVLAALFLGALVGKVAVLQWLGSRLGARFGRERIQQPLVTFLLGFVLVTLLYMVPVLGLATFLVLGVWGLGAAVTAAAGGLRRETREKAAAVAPATPAAMPATPPAAGTADAATAPGSSPSQMAAASPATPLTTTAVPPDLLIYPKAGFWERMGAGFLDFVLVGVVGGLAHGANLGPLLALAYFAAMWTWKGTTIGGILLGLKVVRFDGQPVTFAPALVRALAAGFSMCVMFLGFLWIAWDKDKQAWHDKIAGTVVLRLPRGTPLVCL